MQRLSIVQRLSPAVSRQALAWRRFPEPSDAPRKLGTGTIEDNRRTILFNGCPIVQRLSPAVGSMSEATPQACVVSRIAQAAGSEIFRHSTGRDRVSKPSHEQIATATAQRVFFLPLSRWRERGSGGEGGRVLVCAGNEIKVPENSQIALRAPSPHPRPLSPRRREGS